MYECILVFLKLYKVAVVVALIFHKLIVINFQKNQNFVQVSGVEWKKYIGQIFQCLGITSLSRSLPPAPINNYGPQGSYSNDYSGSSSLTRTTSSYGGDLGQTRGTGGGYGNAGVDLGQTRVISGGYGNAGGDLGQTRVISGGYGNAGGDLGQTRVISGGYGNGGGYGGGAGGFDIGSKR